MDALDAAALRSKRAEAQKISVTLQVGKAGVGPASVAELDAQLRKRKLVKVRLLPSARGEDEASAMATALAAATRSQIIDVRGHTAVFWRA